MAKSNVVPFAGRRALSSPARITLAEAARRLGYSRYEMEQIVSTDPTFPKPTTGAGKWKRVDLAALEAWALGAQAASSA